MRLKSLRWPVAILDIGSNSVRLVVHKEPGAKKPLFNEKVLCLLGQDMRRTGHLNTKGKRRARHAIAGFMQIAKALGCNSVHAIATAAIRDAGDGEEFVRSIRRDLKVPIRIISGELEARYSALGILSSLPKAKGVVADLGGGSLELARIGGGRVHECMTFPLGTLRLSSPGRRLGALIGEHMEMVPESLGEDEPLYAIGGTSRALLGVFRELSGKNGPDISRGDLVKLHKRLEKMPLKKISQQFDIDPVRAPALAPACQLFIQVMKRLESSEMIVTSRGLRDGYLFSMVKPRALARGKRR